MWPPCSKYVWFNCRGLIENNNKKRPAQVWNKARGVGWQDLVVDGNTPVHDCSVILFNIIWQGIPVRIRVGSLPISNAFFFLRGLPVVYLLFSQCVRLYPVRTYPSSGVGFLIFSMVCGVALRCIFGYLSPLLLSTSIETVLWYWGE
jgi:hypothetical protein